MFEFQKSVQKEFGKFGHTAKSNSKNVQILILITDDQFQSVKSSPLAQFQEWWFLDFEIAKKLFLKRTFCILIICAFQYFEELNVYVLDENNLIIVLLHTVKILLVCKNKTQQQPWSKNPLFRWAKNEQRFETQNTVTRWSWALSRWTRINLLHYTPTCLGKTFFHNFFQQPVFPIRPLFVYIPSRIQLILFREAEQSLSNWYWRKTSFMNYCRHRAFSCRLRQLSIFSNCLTECV